MGQAEAAEAAGEAPGTGRERGTGATRRPGASGGRRGGGGRRAEVLWRSPGGAVTGRQVPGPGRLPGLLALRGTEAAVVVVVSSVPCGRTGRELSLPESMIFVDSGNRHEGRRRERGSRWAGRGRAGVQPLLHQRHRAGARHVPGHAVLAHRGAAAVRDGAAGRHASGGPAARPGHRRGVPEPGARPVRGRRPGDQAALGGRRQAAGRRAHQRGPGGRGGAGREVGQPGRRAARRGGPAQGAHRHAGDHRPAERGRAPTPDPACGPWCSARPRPATSAGCCSGTALSTPRSTAGTRSSRRTSRGSSPTT